MRVISEGMKDVPTTNGPGGARTTMTRIAIIKVVAADGSGACAADDEGVEGTYGVSMGRAIGEHPTIPRDADRVDAEDGADGPLIEAAKDVFHDHVGISVLDDFEISLEILPQGAETPSEWQGEAIHWL